MKRKTLSQSEQQQILDKLRNEYILLSRKYGQKVFDILAFEERLQITLKNRIQMDAFLFAEIATFEKLKSKIETKQQQKDNSVLKQIDNIIAKNQKKISKYPDYSFHPQAAVELKKLLGALNLFYQNEFHLIENMLRIEQDFNLIKSFTPFIEKIIFFIGERGRNYAPRIEDHILLLNQRVVDYNKIELDEKRFIKDIALFFNHLKDFLVDIIYNKQFKNQLSPITPIDLRELEDKKLLGKSKEEIIKGMIKIINTILSDFRIQEFKYMTSR